MNEASPLQSSRYDLTQESYNYPEWIGPPRRSILICTHPRSGSTMLGEALYFAGGLGCPLEFIHAGSRARFEQQWNVTGLRQLIHEAWRWRTDPSGTFAIKLFWRDIAELVEEAAPNDFPDLHAIIADQAPPQLYRNLSDLIDALFPNPIYIHLERRDRLRQAVSSVTAVQTGVWRIIPGVESPASNQNVAYDYEKISQLIAGSTFCHSHWRAFFEANRIYPHDVVYEELITDYRGVVEQMLRLVGHCGEPPPVRMERQATAQNEALMRRFLFDQYRALHR